MKPTKKVTNITSQLPTYCDKITNNLGQVINISYNIRFTLFFKSIFLYELLKFSNLQTKALGWKWIQVKKLPTLLDSYQYIVKKGTNKLGQVSNKSSNTRFAYFFKYMFLAKLLKFSNLQTRVFCWKWSKLKKLPTLLVSY